MKSFRLMAVALLAPIALAAPTLAEAKQPPKGVAAIVKAFRAHSFKEALGKAAR